MDRGCGIAFSVVADRDGANRGPSASGRRRTATSHIAGMGRSVEVVTSLAYVGCEMPILAWHNLMERLLQNWCHMMLLCDHGYMARENETGFRMTAEEHSNLDAIRDETIWKMTKEVVVKGGGGATLEILQNLAIGFLLHPLAEYPLQRFLSSVCSKSH